MSEIEDVRTLQERYQKRPFYNFLLPYSSDVIVYLQSKIFSQIKVIESVPYVTDYEVE